MKHTLALITTLLLAPRVLPYRTSWLGNSLAGSERGIGSLEAPGRTGREVQPAADSVELESVFFLDVADAGGGERY